MKRNIIVFVCFLCLALVLFAVAKFVPMGTKPGDSSEGFAAVKINGEEIERIPLSAVGTHEYRQDNGDINVVEITETGVRMAFSNCHNQQCVGTGEITRSNIEFLPNQGFIICLPHRLSVEVVFADGEK